MAESLNLMLRIKSLNKNIPLPFILSSLNSYRKAGRIGAGIVSLTDMMLPKYNITLPGEVSIYSYCLPFIRNDQKEVSSERIMALNPQLVYWLEEVEDGCIFDKQKEYKSYWRLKKFGKSPCY